MDLYALYLLHLGDNALILGHRNSEWTGHGPILEQDIALSNIALDLIGQARNFYQLAARYLNSQSSSDSISEDDLAYLRDARDFRNFTLLEQTNGNWADTILRQFLFSSYQYLLFEDLINGYDQEIRAICEKSIKEIRYHVKWSAEWVQRLGNGTSESHQRMEEAMQRLKPFLFEFFTSADFIEFVIEKGILHQPPNFKLNWITRVNRIFAAAMLPELELEKIPESLEEGKKGIHTKYLEDLLSEMQVLQRSYPGCNW